MISTTMATKGTLLWKFLCITQVPTPFLPRLPLQIQKYFKKLNYVMYKNFLPTFSKALASVTSCGEAREGLASWGLCCVCVCVVGGWSLLGFPSEIHGSIISHFHSPLDTFSAT